MLKNFSTVLLLVLTVGGLALAGCSNGDFSEGGASPSPSAGSNAGAAGDAATVAPTTQSAQPVTQAPQSAP